MELLELNSLFLENMDLDPGFFIQQNPQAIDAGAFHNDVVAVGNQNFLFCHEQAFLDQKKSLGDLKKIYSVTCKKELQTLEVKESEVSLSAAIESYLFNSQMVTLDDGTMALIAPIECQEKKEVKAYLDQLLASGSTPLRKVHYFDLRQSMRNGGGPACLRLRVVLTDKEISASNQSVYMDAALYAKLTAWVTKHYREELSPDDLLDPKLLTEGRAALDELTKILNLGSIYPFQGAL
jgi:succinylarginine dihydrolase